MRVVLKEVVLRSTVSSRHVVEIFVLDHNGAVLNADLELDQFGPRYVFIFTCNSEKVQILNIFCDSNQYVQHI